MKTKSSRAFFFTALCVMAIWSSGSFASCNFDTDDADSPDFMDKIIDCEEAQRHQPNQRKQKKPTSTAAVQLYGDGTVDPNSGISERPVVAAGSMNHSANKLFDARQSYSLRPGAKFEDSVTIATQRLYIEMAHYCAKGWTIEAQRSEPDARQEGDYYLHYSFRCANR